MWARALVVAALLLSACGGAGEGTVRDLGSESGSSGSGSASGGASVDGQGSASAVSSDVGREGGCAPPRQPSDTAVTVTLSEWQVDTPTRLPTGAVTITAGNIGGEPHELVIVRSDDPARLPVSGGRVQEDALPEGTFVGEIESFPAGDTCTGTFDLEPGGYVLFCNLVEEEADGTIESHYEEGMRTVVTVG